VVKAAPAVVRATKVLDFFVSRPGQPFTLAEVADALSVRPGTLLTILQALIDRGYLARHPRHKTYVLGPALIAAGHATLLPYPIVDVARQEIARLADESGIECSAMLVIGNHFVVVASSGRSPHTDPTLVWMGAHLPLQHPFGALFVAWADNDVIERWIGAEYLERSPEDAGRLRAVLARLRLQGYELSFGSGTQETRLLGRAVSGAWARSHPAEATPADGASVAHGVGSLIDYNEAGPWQAEIDLGIEHLSQQFVALNLGERPLSDASTIAVPVFGRADDVALVLTAHGTSEPLSAESLDRAVAQLTGCATHITKDTFARGRR
jgi:DNA-binding IclR family transcriptional regulator